MTSSPRSAAPSGRLEVRLAAASDVRAIARVHVRAWQTAYRGQIPDAVLDGLDEGQRAARWAQLVGAAGHLLYVAVRDGAVVGFCSLIPSRDADAASGTGEIGALYVDPAHWRSGAGTALVDQVRRAATAAGYRSLTLWVLASNAIGRAFYERSGFTSDGATKTEVRGTYSLFEVRYGCSLLETGHDPPDTPAEPGR